MPDAPLLLSSEIPTSSPIKDLAVVGDDPLVVCADWRDAVWTWEPVRDVWRKRSLAFACAEDPLAAEFPEAENQIDQVAATISGGRVVLAAGHDQQGVAFWDLESGELLRGTTFIQDYLAAVAIVEGRGPARFVTAGPNSDVLLLWEAPFDDSPVLLAEYVHIWSLATTAINGRSLVAGADASGVRVWDLARTGKELVFEATATWAVSWSRLDDRPVVVGAADPGVLWVWELPGNDGDRPWGDEPTEPRYEPITGHDGRILAMDTATVGGRPLAVTGSEDETVRVWDLAEGVPAAAPLVGHRGRVEAVVTAVLHGRDVVLSAGLDGVLRVWDLAAVLR